MVVPTCGANKCPPKALQPDNFGLPHVDDRRVGQPLTRQPPFKAMVSVLNPSKTKGGLSALGLTSFPSSH